MSHQLQNFLLSYRSTAYATTKVQPCELFLKRPMHTRLDLLRPDTERVVTDNQEEQVHFRARKVREFNSLGSVIKIIARMRMTVDFHAC